MDTGIDLGPTVSPSGHGAMGPAAHPAGRPAGSLRLAGASQPRCRVASGIPAKRTTHPVQLSFQG